jgi:signal transduction histidine kinase/DNA-binding response OmpR family regulator
VHVSGTEKFLDLASLIPEGDASAGKPLRLLIVEDSPDDAELLVRQLTRAGYDVNYERVDTPNFMRELLAKQTWDLVLSDYNMPRFSGTQALALLGEQKLDVPFIFVSGTIREDIAIAAMKAGAHDYVMKGNTKRLIPAIERELAEAVLRRQRRQAKRQLQLQNERIRALHAINTAITSTLDLHTVLATLLEKIDHLLPYCAATIRLVNQASGLLEPVACRNLYETEWKADRLRSDCGLADAVFESKSPMMILNTQSSERVREPEFYRHNGLVSYLGAPLIVKDNAIGVLGFYTREEHEFREEEAQFLTALAGQAALAIYNSRLHEETKRQAADLAKANKIKSEFLGVMSHELRTPLNIIMGYTGMVQEGVLGELRPQQSDALRKALDHSRYLLAMIDSILRATQIETCEVKSEKTSVTLSNLLDGLKSAYEVGVKTDLKLHWEYPFDLPSIDTDGDMLRRILHNLVDNAIKFTEKGWVKISARLVAEEGAVVFEVVDTGIGIARDNLPLIFEMFRQIDSSKTRAYEGVGLGLYIVKKHTELLGGRVNVKSEIGKGSAFTVSLPLRY